MTAAGSEGVRVIAGRYRLVARLGAGAMGTVWRAFDQVLQTEAALKEIEFAGGVPDAERADRVERVERALREARHAAKLRGHPHVVTILDVVLENGLPWIVMELVPSRSLFDVVRMDGPLPVTEVARIGIAMIDALVAARDHGIVHRDVKPSNVLIGDDGRVVLTDFGIATGDGDPTLTVTGVLGTPLYMAPERLNNAPATFEGDLFSLGGTLYFAAEGAPPFQRDNFGAMLAAIMLHPPAPVRLGGSLTEALNGLLEKDPMRRMPAERARELLVALMTRPDPEYGGPGRGAARPASPVVHAGGLSWQARTRLAGTGYDGRPAHDAASGWEPEDMSPTRARTRIDDSRAHPAWAAQTRVDETPVDETPVDPAPDRATPVRPAPGGADVPDPPTGINVVEQGGGLLISWESSARAVAYRVLRMVADPSATGGRRERTLGITTATELFDAGIPKGRQIWHEVTALASESADAAASIPVRGPNRIVLPAVTALRADMADDAVMLSWRPVPGHDEVVIERTHDESSPLRGAMRRYRGFGGSFVDNEVQPAAVYRYRVWVTSGEDSDGLRPAGCAEVLARVVARPRAVLDLEARGTLGGVVLRWTVVPGAAVRIYATAAPEQAGLAGTGPFGEPDHEIGLGSLEGRARLVGESRRGRLTDREASGTVVYTPVSVTESRVVVGAAVTHTVV